MKYPQALLIFGIILLAGCSSPKACPASCEDNNYCTIDFCSNETGFSCVHNMTYLTSIFGDDMNAGLDKWNDVYKTNVWGINNGVLEANYTYSQSSMPAYLFSNINSFKGDYVMTGKFNLTKGVLLITSRITDNKGYLVLLQNSVVLMKTNSTAEGVPPSVLAMSQTAIPKNVWFNFKLTTIGSRIIFYIEDRKLIDAEDTSPFLAGNLGFAILSDKNFNNSDASIDSAQGIAQIDDIRIYEVNSSNYSCIQ